MEKSLGQFSQYRKLHTDGAKNTDLEIRPAMGQRIVDDRAPDIGKFKEGVDEVKAKVSKPTGPNYPKDKTKDEYPDQQKELKDLYDTGISDKDIAAAKGNKKSGMIKKMATGGKVSQLAKANGCAVRGKSKGRII
jgi:hypothetical protein